MENVEKIAAALVKVQAAISPAVKNKENPHLRSKYADLGAVWDACQVPLTENAIAVTQIPVYHDGLMFCKTILLHESGQSLEGEYMIRPTKEDPQGYGSAFTYARRYSLCGMLGVTNDDDDGHRASARGKTANIDKVKGADVISTAERIAMKKVWTKAGKSDETVMAYLREAFDVDATAKILKKDYQDIMAWCAEPKPTAGA